MYADSQYLNPSSSFFSFKNEDLMGGGVDSVDLGHKGGVGQLLPRCRLMRRRGVSWRMMHVGHKALNMDRGSKYK